MNQRLRWSPPDVVYTPIDVTSGALTLNADGSDFFSYKVYDGTAYSHIDAIVSITVNPVNDVPVTNDQEVTTPVTVTLGGSPLSFEVATQPGHGTLSGAAPNLTYTPAADFYGSDSFRYKVNDGTADSNIDAIVSITVNPVIDAPVANDQGLTTPEDTPVTITLGGSDVDQDSLSFGVATQPEHGTLSGTAPNLTYTPAGNYYGSDNFSFSFTASDSALSDTATISIIVTPVNDTPIAADDSYNVSPDNTLAVATASGVIANDFDTEEDGLSAVLISRPSNGVLTFSADGSFIYTPNAGFNGLDVFSYKANDGTADSYFDAIVRISVNPVTDAPVANDQGVTTPEDTPVTITLGSSPLSFDVATQPGHGTLSGVAPN